MAARSRARGTRVARVRESALALPGVDEGTSYGTPAWRVKGKLFARLHQDGESLVLRASFDQRELLMEKDPRAYFITDHYTNHEMMQVRLSAAKPEAVDELLAESWRHCAPKKLREAFDAG